jgi:hypothetical protein
MDRRLAAILTAFCLLLVPPSAHAAPAAAQQWIGASDIHFSPYIDVKLTERLAAAPPERWRAIFASAGPQVIAPYGSDTNYALLESTLDAMKSHVPSPRAVIVTGDFLAHNFRAQFDASVKSHDDDSYHAFVDKTIAFLALEFRAAFPKAQIIPVVGNDDGYCGDYASTPRSFFFLHMAQAFAPSIGATDQGAFTGQFTTGGYYTVQLPAGSARAVVLNDVFWSWRYANTCGEKTADPGGDELTWLRTTLASATTPTWVLAHIPPGIDVYATLRIAVQADAPIVTMLNPTFNDAFVSLLATPSSRVAMALAGHTHMNSYRVIGAPGHDMTSMLVLPSVSPIFGNNPGFSVLDVDPDTANVLDDHVFVLDHEHWRREYDFDGAYGVRSINATTLDHLHRGMFADDRLRHRYTRYFDGESGRATIADPSWRAYWCGNVSMTVTEYRACAVPQVQTSLPPHPPAPPPPTPSPSPSPSPTSSASPTPKPGASAV